MRSHTKRQSNIELLRMLSMLMVLGLHCNFVSLGKPTAQSLATNFNGECIRVFIENICLVSVNVFILISGFFGIRLRREKLFKYLFQVLFFACVAILIAVLALGKEISVLDGIKFVYGFFFSNWFVCGYFALMLISPLINTYSEGNDNKRLLKIVLSLFVVDSILGYVLPEVKGIGALNGYSVIHLLFVYSLGRLLSKTRESLVLKSRSLLALSFVILIVINSLLSVLSCLGFLNHWNPIAYNNPVVIIASVALFLLFEKTQMGHYKCINSMAASAFSAFLIHANSLIYPFYINHSQLIHNRFYGIWELCLFVLFILSVYLIAFLINQCQIRLSNFIYNSFNHVRL